MSPTSVCHLAGVQEGPEISAVDQVSTFSQELLAFSSHMVQGSPGTSEIFPAGQKRSNLMLLAFHSHGHL